MKKILSTLFIATFIIAGASTVNAQTKAKSDATVVKEDVKAVPTATKALAVPKKMVRKSDAATPSQPTQAAPATKAEAAAASKKELKRVAVKSATATPVVKSEGTKQ